WRDFGGIEYAEATACSGADVDQSSSGSKPLDNQVNRLSDAILHGRHSFGDELVFLVDETDYFDRRTAIYVLSPGVGLFGDGFHLQELIDVVLKHRSWPHSDIGPDDLSSPVDHVSRRNPLTHIESF